MLNRTTKNITSKYPEKVLQFGTGVLLRGLIDYFIDKANKKGIYNGSVVMVKTTGPDVSEFTNQDNLYTISVRGLENGLAVEEDIIVDCISRTLSTKTHWEEILKTSENPEIQLVVSNTTEAGLQYVEENVLVGCPESFPGKLTAWLHKRFTTNQAETLVVPTELIVNNGGILKEIVYKHVSANNLGDEFLSWLNQKVKFSSSLVDRIVPGKPNQEEANKLFDKIGYKDTLIIKAEVYRLWAIEGENIELDSFIKHKRLGVKYQPDYTRKIDDLYNAYQFAKIASCNNVNVTKAHQILTQNILPAGRQGRIRVGNMYVTTTDGKIEYVAAAPGSVNKELGKFYADLEILQAADLSLHEVFFFAAMLHLLFVKIHPFDDGNGRTARLIEKWFLANKLGEKAWLIQSEKNYYQQHQTYYKNLRLLGLEYELLDYYKAVPFLAMLPKALAM